MQITLVEDLDALRPRKAEWNALVERSETSTIFQTFEWHASWWKVFGGDVRPLVLLAEADGDLLGIAPLMLSERCTLGRKRRVIEFLGTSASSYCDFIVDPTRRDVLAGMLCWLAENDGQWDLLHLRDVPNTSTTLAAVPEFFTRRGYPTDVRLLYEAPSRLLGDTTADRRLLGKRSLRRHDNYFRRRGHLAFEPCGTAEEIMGYLDLFFQQHVKRWASTDTPSLFLDRRQRVFYREVVRALAPTGWLLFCVLLFDDTPIAFALCFEYGNRIIAHKLTMNADYLKHSPGQVMLKNLLEYALKRGVAELDFSIGGQAYKYRFANHIRSNYAIRVFCHSAPYYIDRLLLDTEAWVRESPVLAHLGRYLLRQWRDLQLWTQTRA